eukprot:CAMPEP_0177736378 /NCGR_PEP_ID=MMETSP0484_2-20121128/25299_1 /TAXON_ID=354590 /ORGANISM="Rhodomonas lens, Strain RHODO" /LENGTH=74 /DNA_ID=CAMNT_0019250047 /DNA_START=212 /DNA_END=433 /DNA_ORIENTATION=-
MTRGVSSSSATYSAASSGWAGAVWSGASRPGGGLRAELYAPVPVPASPSSASSVSIMSASRQLTAHAPRPARRA